MNELPPPPEPDTHCWDDDVGRDVWSYSAEQMRIYAAAAVAAERERQRLRADEAEKTLAHVLDEKKA
jgi:hypothetical protein